MAFPLSADHRYHGNLEWRRGDVLCALWIATDTVVCTASVWHLAAISLDRLAVSGERRIQIKCWRIENFVIIKFFSSFAADLHLCLFTI